MIYLASASPRRAELLRQIGVEFTPMPVDIDESRRVDEAPAAYVCRMAREKAAAAAIRLATLATDWLALAADTAITIDGDIIGKPVDQPDCQAILARLSARQHLVLSAVALATPTQTTLRLTQNRVSFRDLPAAEIEAYCAGQEPLDKAGAYAIQGRAAIFARQLQGSYSAVMGLPLFETAELLRAAGALPES